MNEETGDGQCLEIWTPFGFLLSALKDQGDLSEQITVMFLFMNT